VQACCQGGVLLAAWCNLTKMDNPCGAGLYQEETQGSMEAFTTCHSITQQAYSVALA
jgi:hypothetical protein